MRYDTGQIVVDYQGVGKSTEGFELIEIALMSYSLENLLIKRET